MWTEKPKAFKIATSKRLPAFITEGHSSDENKKQLKLMIELLPPGLWLHPKEHD